MTGKNINETKLDVFNDVDDCRNVAQPEAQTGTLSVGITPRVFKVEFGIEKGAHIKLN